jgi:hypothetical protein
MTGFADMAFIDAGMQRLSADIMSHLSDRPSSACSRVTDRSDPMKIRLYRHSARSREGFITTVDEPARIGTVDDVSRLFPL